MFGIQVDGNEAANAVIEGRKIPFDVDVYVGRAGMTIGFFSKIDMSCISNSSRFTADWRIRRSTDHEAQFRWIKAQRGDHRIYPEPSKFGVEREPAVIANFAIVSVKTKSGSLER